MNNLYKVTNEYLSLKNENWEELPKKLKDYGICIYLVQMYAEVYKKLAERKYNETRK